MTFLDPELDAYASRFSSPESDVLSKLNRETNLKVLYPQMLSGHLQGRVLSLLSRICKPRRILEIGTYTGYSAICLAEGLAKDGRLITIDIDPEREDMVQRYFEAAGISDRTELRIGHAADIVPQLEGPFDIVFIDADKENYSRYYELVFPKLAVGGLLIADNVLWSGRVTNPEIRDKETLGLRLFVETVAADARVDQILLTVRDGLLVVLKNKE